MNPALLLTALFNGAWQGAVLCGLALIAFRLFRRLNATTMFTVWSVLLAIAVLLPFLNYAFAPKPYVVHLTPATVVYSHHVVSYDAVTARPRAITASKQVTVSNPSTAGVMRSRITPSVMASKPSVMVWEAFTAAVGWLSHNALAILLSIGAIALLRLAVLMRDVVRMLAARRRVRSIESPVALSNEISRPFRFAASDDFTSPCVLGFTPPLIVIPEELLAEGSTELTSVILHEREHVRRFDDIQNVIQRFIGAIAFFCPGVRIALRELALCREQICDDAAVNETGDRVSYAMTLTDLAQWAQGRGAPVPSLIFRRKHLLHRLEVLLDSAVSHSMRMNRRFAAGAVAALVIAAALVLRIQVPVIAETMTAPHAVAAPHAVPALAPVAAHKMLHGVRAKIAPLAAPHAVPGLARVHKVLHGVRAKLAPHVAPPAPAIAPQALLGRVQRAIALAAVAPRARYEIPYAVAYAYAYRQSDATVVARAFRQARHDSTGGDLLDALNSAGLRDIPVDQLIALRDHGVNADLVRAAVSYFGRVNAADLTYLMDHGVGPNYIGTLRQSGISGISPADAVKLMDHGVSSSLIHAAYAYFSQRPSAEDLVYLADHGVGAPFIESLRENGVSVCSKDAVDMIDHGVDAAYVAKIRRSNPHATISDIIRLHDAGF